MARIEIKSSQQPADIETEVIDDEMIQEPHDPEIDEVIESERAGNPNEALPLLNMLREMGASYRADPVRAVRSQGFNRPLA